MGQKESKMNETTNNNAKLADNSTNKMDDKIKNSLKKNFEKNLAIESNKIIQVENNNSNNIASSCDKPGNKNSKIPEENLRKKSDETDKVNDTKVIFKKEDIHMEEKNNQHSLHLQKQYQVRITIAKQGQESYHTSDFKNAIKFYNQYLRLLAEINLAFDQRLLGEYVNHG